MYFRSPIGLIIGLSSVALIHLCLIIPYYYFLRIGMIRRPFIQLKNDPPKNFLTQVQKHLTNPEGFLLLGGYLSITWIFGIMPDSYYKLWESNISFIDVALQLIINDFYQTIAHLLEHKIKIIYKYSHKSHHKHVRPTLFDAFDGQCLDTFIMILIPLFSTQCTLNYLLYRDVSVWSYMAFGSIYANYLCLIHSEYEHPWDQWFMSVGICTPADHHVHHKLFNRNYGHIFMIWDKMFGTYTDPRSVKKHFKNTF